MSVSAHLCVFIWIAKPHFLIVFKNIRKKKRTTGNSNGNAQSSSKLLLHKKSQWKCVTHCWRMCMLGTAPYSILIRSFSFYIYKRIRLKHATYAHKHGTYDQVNTFFFISSYIHISLFLSRFLQLLLMKWRRLFVFHSAHLFCFESSASRNGFCFFLLSAIDTRVFFSLWNMSNASFAAPSANFTVLNCNCINSMDYFSVSLSPSLISLVC